MKIMQTPTAVAHFTKTEIYSGKVLDRQQYFQGRPLTTDVDDDSDNFPRFLLRSPAFLQDPHLWVDLLFPLLIAGYYF